MMTFDLLTNVAIFGEKRKTSWEGQKEREKRE